MLSIAEYDILPMPKKSVITDIDGSVARRLREWGESAFPSMAALARAIGVTPQTLNVYLSAKTRPGNAMQDRLRSLGADVEYIMTGKTAAGAAEARDAGSVRVEFSADREVSDELRAVYRAIGEEIRNLEEADLPAILAVIKAVRAAKKKSR
jgi:transcriptional regulator with XRE-family HTH domain